MGTGFQCCTNSHTQKGILFLTTAALLCYEGSFLQILAPVLFPVLCLRETPFVLLLALL